MVKSACVRAVSMCEGMVPFLQLEDQDRIVFRYRIRHEQVVIGRSDACDLALPSDTVSRRHCVLVRRDEGWTLVDESRHGTWVHGVKVGPGGALVEVGQVIELGGFQLRLVDALPSPAAAAATQLIRPATYEELVETFEGGLMTRRASVRVLTGSHEGARHALRRDRSTLGGAGASIEIDSELPPDAATVWVVRGRVMVEPGSCPVFVGGTRCPRLMPVQHGEEIRVGNAIVEVVSTFEEDVAEPLEHFGDLRGRSEAMVTVYRVLDRIARHDAPVLLVGESGTGKELAARGLHDAGARNEGPFVPLNCAAIPERLVESELFGHTKGAFTGADTARPGAFVRAHGGTLFLDELGEMSLAVQAKLLRVLESGAVQPLGGVKSVYPDVRVVAATNRDLGEMVREGTFRQDLLHRLAVLAVRLPALRERRGDVPELARVLLSQHHPGASLSGAAEDMLVAYDWPGNVRELRNVLTRAVVLGGERVTPDAISFSPWAFTSVGPVPAPDASDEGEERERLLAALRRHRGNRARAARDLGMPRTSLVYRLMKLGIT